MPWWTILAVATYVDNGFVADAAGIGGQGSKVMEFVSYFVMPADYETPFLHCRACIFVNFASHPSHRLGRSNIANPYLKNTPSLNSNLESESPLTAEGMTDNQAPVERDRVVDLCILFDIGAMRPFNSSWWRTEFASRADSFPSVIVLE